jgi:hypothetical protein
MYHFLMDSENCTCSPGQGEESSVANFSAMPASVLSRLNLTAERSCCNASGTDACRGSQSGTTFVPLTGDRGEDLSMLCAAGSHARTFPQQDAAKASPESGRDCGEKWPASLAKYDPDTCSWRTRQYSLQGDLELFSATWPRWGLMRGGECWERTMPELPTFASGSGFWLTPRATDVGRGEKQETFLARMGDRTDRCYQSLPAQVNAMRLPTPRKSDSERGGRRDLIQAVRGNPNSHYTMFPTPKVRDRAADEPNREGGMSLGVAVRMYPTPGANEDSYRLNGNSQQSNSLGAMARRETLAESPASGGQLNPHWVEWLMGWPLNWTSLEPMNKLCFNDWKTKLGPQGGTAEIQSGEMRNVWWDKEPTTPPQERRPNRQQAGERGDSVPSVSHQGSCSAVELGSRADQGCTVSRVPRDVSVEEDAEKHTLREAGMPCGVWEDCGGETLVPRVAVGVAHRVDRLAAIGNGQVPSVAALAWRTLNA